MLTTIWTAISGVKVYVMLGALAGMCILSGTAGYKLANVKYYKLQNQIIQTNLKAEQAKNAKILSVLQKDNKAAVLDDAAMERIEKALKNESIKVKPGSCFTKPESDRLRKWPKA